MYAGQLKLKHSSIILSNLEVVFEPEADVSGCSVWKRSAPEKKQTNKTKGQST